MIDPSFAHRVEAFASHRTLGSVYKNHGNKGVASMRSLLLAIAMIALMGLSPARPAWLICLCVHADRSTTGRCIRPPPPYVQPGSGAVRDRRTARRAPSRKVLAGQSRMTIRQLGPGRDADRFAGRAGRTVGTFSRGPELWWAKMRGKRNHLLYSFGFMLVVFISAVLFSTASNRPLWIRYEDRRIEYLCVCWCVTMNVQM